MYCPKCGEKLINPNQKFCQACGANLKELIPNRSLLDKQPIIPSKSQPTSQSDFDYRFKDQQKQIYEKSDTNKYAKLCFAFGLISFILSYVSSIFYFLIISIPYLIIVFSIININDLIFGSLSRSFKRKSEEKEAVTRLRKAGSVLAIIGIVYSSINIILSIFNAAIGFSI